MTLFDHPAERIMVALDVDEIEQAQSIITELAGLPVTYKVGLQLGTYQGWDSVVSLIHEAGAKIFCDTKFKDIPATVEKASRSITRHQPDFFNIMVDNNMAALEGAVAGVAGAVRDYNLAAKPVLLGVTVLTSMSDEESNSIYGADSATKVLQFAEAAAATGLEGLVCSPSEARTLKSNERTKDMLLVTPGIRPEWAAAGDQSRIMSPAQAVADGADYLVIGRPITQPPQEVGSSRNAIELIIEELS